MTQSIRRSRRACILTIFIVMTQVFVVQAMAINGELHKLLHNHADDPTHECAVTMMMNGGYDSVVPDVLPVEFTPEQPPIAVVFPRAADVMPGHLADGSLAQVPPRGP